MVKRNFENTNCKVKKFFVQKYLNEDGAELDGVYSAADFNTLNCAIKCTGKKPFIKQWFEDDKKREYECMAFVPYGRKSKNNTPKHVYNTFSGFQAKESENSTEPVWLSQFMYEQIADGDRNVGDFLINMMAQLIQFPEVNPMVAIILRGTTGIGKDTLILLQERMIGRAHIYRTADVSEPFPKSGGGGFNAVLKNKLILQLNEADGYDTAKIEAFLLHQVTTEYNNIKEKYMGEQEQKNYIRVWFLSNKNSPIEIKPDDRRYFTHIVGEKFRGNTDYWNKLYKIINSNDRIDELYTWLLNRDISKFDPKRDRPKTRAYKIATSVSIPAHIKFLKEVLFDDDEREARFNKHPTKDIWFIKPKCLYSAFESWALDHHLFEKGKFRGTHFKKALLEFNSIGWDRSVRGNGKVSKYVLFDRARLSKELEKYNFTVEQESEEDILDLDD